MEKEKRYVYIVFGNRLLHCRPAARELSGVCRRRVLLRQMQMDGREQAQRAAARGLRAVVALMQAIGAAGQGDKWQNPGGASVPLGFCFLLSAHLTGSARPCILMAEHCIAV